MTTTKKIPVSGARFIFLGFGIAGAILANVLLFVCFASLSASG
jgi:multidrug transporter EmrE-like cation transporter